MLASFRKFIGVPFVDGGRDFKGADCLGIVMLVFREFGIELPDYKIGCFDTNQIDEKVNTERLSKSWKRLKEPEAPCIVVMRIDPDVPELCNHLGVYIGDNEFIHTLNKTQSVRTRLDHLYFSRKIEGFYEYVGQ